MKLLRTLNLAFATAAILGPSAHVLEMLNKFRLSGDLWLLVQQHLYAGWGPLLGAPAEIGALATSLWLAVLRRDDVRALRLSVLAGSMYAGMIAAFFLLNAPVNAAVSAAGRILPENWQTLRLHWEAGHGLAAILAVIGLWSLLRARNAEMRSGHHPIGSTASQ